MSLERVDNDDGTYSVNATGKDTAALKDAFVDLSAADREMKLDKRRENPDRRLKNGRWIDAESAEKLSHHVVGNSTISVTAPDGGWLGFDSDGRAVWELPSPEKWKAWIKTVTVQGNDGWAIVP